MEKNGIEQNKVIFIGCFKIKEQKCMKKNGMKVILFESNIKGMEWNHFMIILLLEPYFKIKS